jgi:hypothetical protein
MAVVTYDAMVAPDPLAWLQTPDEERIALVVAYHIGIGDIGDSQQIHASLHAIVENQIAMGGEVMAVRERLRQLMQQGLDRHDAVHAIAYVLARHIQWIARGGVAETDGHARYFRELKRMTGNKYRAILRSQEGMESFGEPVAPWYGNP